jgi:Flp pilus assembly protein TadG
MKRTASRRGAAAVEFAVVAPLLFLLVFGTLEFGRAMMSLDLLANAARAGARTGALPNKSNSDVQDSVLNVLNGVGVKGATVSVEVNGKAGDVASAAQGDSVTVSASVPFAKVSWLGQPLFLGETTLSQKMTMRKE